MLSGRRKIPKATHGCIEWFYKSTSSCSPFYLKKKSSLACREHWRLTIPFSASTKSTTTAKTIIKRQECRNGQFTLYCEADTNMNAVQDKEWKIKFSDTGWVTFSSCSNISSVINCFDLRDKLPVGITLLNHSNGAMTIERSRNASASHDHAQIMCQVHYFDHSVSPSSRVYQVNFTAQCKFSRVAYNQFQIVETKIAEIIAFYFQKNAFFEKKYL